MGGWAYSSDRRRWPSDSRANSEASLAYDYQIENLISSNNINNRIYYNLYLCVREIIQTIQTDF